MRLQLRSEGTNLELRSKEGRGHGEGESLPGRVCTCVRGRCRKAHVASRVEGLMQVETQPEPWPCRALKAREKLRP